MAEMAYGAGRVHEAGIMERIGDSINDLRLRFHGKQIPAWRLNTRDLWFENRLSFEIYRNVETGEDIVRVSVYKLIDNFHDVYDPNPVLVIDESIDKFPSDYLVAKMALVC